MALHITVWIVICNQDKKNILKFKLAKSQTVVK